MKRFLSTTAVLLTMSGAAYADAHASAFGTVALEQSDFLASNLIGMRIYSSETEFENDAEIEAGAEKEWDDIGEINDIIVSKDGNVTAVILGIGGFLGIGERDIAVSMDDIRIVREQGDADDRFLVVNTSKEMLEQSPAFERNMEADANEAKMKTEQVAESAEVKTEVAAENAEAKTEVMAENAEAKTEEMAADAEAKTEEMAANAEAETKEAVVATENTVERDLLTRPAVERENYADVEWTEMTADDLEGARIYGMEDEDIGEIDELIVDDSGKITHVLADIGGFLGMGEHTVKLSFEELQLVRNGDANDFRIYVDSTEGKLETLPEYED
ncbi:PRC-barrel domain-containing protein [Sulfitobacter brevis]|uniref:PRC-barrel domain-containing protein n=1 Tax=Sulfitobacter brevis TaxID=74348 RepID=A0A1I1X595_9RHOB|nr:PRC-barrel domain-containing protein [Sulfitobacter brevis]SFE00480.1 PRC-barrel domain-containing protein [Sulfitobacter brevis]